jgi:hypothetical protein
MVCKCVVSHQEKQSGMNWGSRDFYGLEIPQPLSRSAGSGAELRGVQRPPPALDQIFFQQTCELWQKHSLGIFYALFTFISDLKIIQQAVKLPRAPHNNSISFCANIVRHDWPEIASQRI